MLRVYGGEFEMIGKLSIVDQIRETQIRFRNITDYLSYFNSFDERYDAADAILNEYFDEIDSRQLNLVNRSQYGNGCDFKHEIIEYRGKICFIPTKGFRFII